MNRQNRKFLVLVAALAAVATTSALAATAPGGQLVSGYEPGAAAVHPLNVDATGRLQVVGSAAGGSVYGNNANGTAPTQPPVFVGGWDGTLVRSLSTDTAGRVNINNIAGTVSLPTGAATETTLSAASGKLPASLGAKTGATSLSVVAASDGFSVNASQTGTWNVTNISGTVSLPTGAATAAKQPALGTAGTPSADVITVQGAVSMTPLGIAHQPTTASGNAITPVVSSAVENGHVLKASAGNFYRLAVTTGATAGYVMVFNSTTVPADGAVTPLLCRAVAANSSIEIDHTGMPQRYSTGISAAFSSTGCFTKTASATAMFEGDVQ